ncbi:MAG TPA: metallophosphoesterase [Actinomycetota bacterium]|jgi:predicted phosphodiesterase|nr:metallophosphoesterase [Actinomycetota bacterium]
MRLPRACLPQLGRLLVAIAVGVSGMWLALLLAGRHDYSFGPFRVELYARPGRGITEISLPPFGRVQADTHVSPVRLTATVDLVDPQDLSAVVARQGVEGLIRETEQGAYAALRRHATRTLLVGLAGALAASVLTYREQWRRVLIGSAGAVVILGLFGGLAWATFRPAAFLQPTFTGSLSLAPRLVGPLQEATGRIEDFRAQLARLVGAAADAYDVIVNEPRPSGRGITVLHISDIHLSPIGMDFAQRLSRSFDVDLVVDTGDLTSFGTRLEQEILRRIPEFRVPYVFTPGNHDSATITARVAAAPNAVVLEGRMVEVEGLRIFGAGHPLFTPSASRQLDPVGIASTLREAGEKLTVRIAVLLPRPDLVAIHDDRMAEPWAGLVPLVVSGHFHEGDERTLDETLFLRVGSTGGGGLEGLARETMSAEILYFEGEPPALVAYDVVDLDPETGDLTVRRNLTTRLIRPVGPSPAPTG